MRYHPGYTLIELAIVLLACGTLLALAAPRFQRARDTLAVRSARAELASAFAATRAAAVLGGGAVLVIDPPAASAWIEAGDPLQQRVEYPLGRRHGVRLDTERGTRIGIRYDALGIGRLANTSVVVRRGDAAATITVSAYGRVRL